MDRLLAYLRLMRPANLPTAVADVMVGYAAVGMISGPVTLVGFGFQASVPYALWWLMLSTTCLYAGGVVFNDVFDYKVDSLERPDRPIPSGKATMMGAISLGTLLMAGGVLAAFQVWRGSGIVALVVAALALLYDGLAKKHKVAGPVVMGLTRAANLFLGMSVILGSIPILWFLGLIPLFYIGAITLISQGEVQGGNSENLREALMVYGIVLIFPFLLPLFVPFYDAFYYIPFALLLAGSIMPPLLKAMKKPTPGHVQGAVKAGVLSLIILDAGIAAGFAGWAYGLTVLGLLVISQFLAKLFAVT